MDHKSSSIMRRISLMVSSLRTGIVLVILLGISAAAGTFILQRRLTDPDTLMRTYSPSTLRWLDAVGLTDVFHTRWFVVLLALTGLNMVLASIDRFPQAWRFIARPHRDADAAFLNSLKFQKQIPIRSEEQGIEATESAFRSFGLKPQRVTQEGRISLFAERHRLTHMAAYVVHASLILVFVGGIADAVWGYRGFLALTQNQQSNTIEVRNGAPKVLPFTLRCEAAGRENYADGSPRSWWSKLAVLEGGQVVERKEISVNEPLTYRGIRFFQASYGDTGEVSKVQLQATLKSGAGQSQEIELKPNELVRLDAETTVRMIGFVPDFVIDGGQIKSRSPEPNNPGIQLLVESRSSRRSVVWLFPRYPDFSHADNSPYLFKFRSVEMGYYTGLQVAYEPGQWAVWIGFALAALGLAGAFYFVHLRVWAVPALDSHGRPVLWVGASASKNREEVAGRFSELIEKIEHNLAGEHVALHEGREVSLAR